MVERIKTPGKSTVEVKCRVGDATVKRICQSRIRSGGVQVKPQCNTNVSVTVRVTAKQAGKSRSVWKETVTVKKRPAVTCRANGKG